MDSRTMDKIVQKAWHSLPSSFQDAMQNDRKAPRQNLRLSITVDNVTVEFKATAKSIIGYIKMDADVVVEGVERKQPGSEPTDI